MKIWEDQSEYKPVCLRFDSKEELYAFIDLLDFVSLTAQRTQIELKTAYTIKELISKL